MKTQLPHIVLLAGGRGTRLNPITDTVQKCLIPIDGKPVLSHVLNALSEAFDAAHVVMCVSYLADDVQRFVQNNKPHNLSVEYIHDTGHAKLTQIILGSRGKTTGTFLFVPGDVVAKPYIYRQIYDAATQDKVYAAYALSPKLDEVDTHALAKLAPSGRITEISRPFPNPTAEYLRDMSIHGLNQSFYEYAAQHSDIAHCSLLNQLAIDNGKYIVGIEYPDQWVHVAYPEDLQKSMSIPYPATL